VSVLKKIHFKINATHETGFSPWQIEIHSSTDKKALKMLNSFRKNLSHLLYHSIVYEPNNQFRKLQCLLENSNDKTL